MKKLLLFSVFTLATSIAVFSQTSFSQKKFSFENSLDIPNSPQPFDTLQSFSPKGFNIDTMFLEQFDSLEKFIDGNQVEKNLFQNQDHLQIVENAETIYSMRIVKPIGNFPIQIHQPDSTKNYTLRIKEF
tara:strand:- start:124 stop:513 length:390 start_codon:yes stop_codon:yes gene_type:complete